MSSPSSLSKRSEKWPVTQTRRIVAALESDSIPLGYSILVFFFSITLRNFIELFATNEKDFPLDRMIHFWLFFVSAALFTTLILHLATREPVVKVLKVVLPASIVLIVTPIVDLTWTLGEGARITYLVPNYHEDFVYRFFTFFGDYNNHGASPGIRVEIAIILIANTLYCIAKGAGLRRGLLAAISIYTIIFAHGALPLILNQLMPLFDLEYKYTDPLLGRCFLLSSVLAAAVVAWRSSPRYFLTFAKDLRWMRVLYYELLFFLGYLFDCQSRPIQFTHDNLFHMLLIPISLILAILFSIVTNNLADVDIDRVSNRDRPLYKKGIDREHYRKTAAPFFVLSLLVALITDQKSFLYVLLFIALYFIYSMPPFRFKRVPFFSKLVISTNSLAIFVMGFFLRDGALTDIPGIVFAYFVIGFTTVANFIDLKDFEGDRAAGIKTIPVLLGLKRAKLLCGAAFLVFYLSIFFAIGDLVLLPALVVLGGLQLYFITRTKYRELPVFVTLNASIIVFIIYVIWLAPFDSLKSLGQTALSWVGASS
ncbi:MAG: UbiA family prenyltransferase [Deltaproteobacteria bacterium]|nr:UbiA family prenyltransferase [Deltaproteobacteria bacterium]